MSKTEPSEAAMEPFQTIYCLTPAGIALREELLKEEAGND